MSVADRSKSFNSLLEERSNIGACKLPKISVYQTLTYLVSAVAANVQRLEAS